MRRPVLLVVNPPGGFVWDPAIVDGQLDEWGRVWAESRPVTMPFAKDFPRDRQRGS